MFEEIQNPMKKFFKIFFAILFALAGFAIATWGYYAEESVLSSILLIVGNIFIISAVDIAFSFIAEFSSRKEDAYLASMKFKFAEKTAV
ncbi:MAG: hypothetical protein INR69_11360 [Mucilaginibacter polytrichastri]|nr:hypothetical protein [Mucilaginibacter polytrichastri]